MPHLSFSDSRSLIARILITAMSLVLIQPAFADINWEPSLDSALQRAARTRKPVFAYVHTAHAQDCRRFEQQTLVHLSVQQMLAENFICARIDAESDMNSTQRLRVISVPTIVVLNERGEEIFRMLTVIPPDQLTPLLAAIRKTSRAQALPDKQNAIFAEGFDTADGWNIGGLNTGSSCQLSLIQGREGMAFRMDYQLHTGEHNWAEITKEFPQGLKLPDEYTIVFLCAGRGGDNHLTVKMVDETDSTFGFIMRTPRSFKAHQFAVTSRDIGYLWGGSDSRLDPIKSISLAVSPNHDVWDTTGPEPAGVVYFDEMVILPGIRTEFATAELWSEEN